MSRAPLPENEIKRLNKRVLCLMDERDLAIAELDAAKKWAQAMAEENDALTRKLNDLPRLLRVEARYKELLLVSDPAIVSALYSIQFKNDAMGEK